MLGRFLRTGPWCLLAAGFMSSAWAELPVEQITVASLPPASPYRLYFTDVALPHLPDGRLYVIDGRNLKLEGMVSTGSFAQTTLAPDRSEIYAVITYFSKLNRGERHEEINVFDAATLKLKAEIPYPARHTQALPSVATMRTSADGRFILVQNATPATSIGIVDRRQGKLIAEVPTPGCYGVYPAKSTDRFSTLCGDGTMLTVSHDRDGNPTARKKSGRFFDPDEDALFTSGAQAGDVYHFPSFKGNWQSVNVAGETAVAETPWSMIDAKDAKQGWRPGGTQPVALHQASGIAYVTMHPKGAEGSHKNPAREIWVFDVAGKKRLSRVKVHDISGVAVSQGEQPRLFAFAIERPAITVFEGGPRPKPILSGPVPGDTPTLLETHQ
ncbi:MAG: amine dehydrogenase [Rhodocyclaceae bacterium]|nr:amine dehydrogenase [Rhodocyclaceae bacterium]